ncbi:MAG: winged helix-turn-helix domain-containing protein [Pyrinomonadaceae bacterium]|nr:winged helix-turn-helix domain-containing protein [Pyrinomonadaceae bacterium]
MQTTANTNYSFADFEIDAARRLLLKNGEAVSLNPKAFDLLLTLVENRGAVLSKNELLDKVWENQFVEENNLTVHVSALRKALGEKKNENRFLVTVPGKGYKFVGVVQSSGDEEKEIIIESRTVSRVVIEEENEAPETEIEIAKDNFPKLKKENVFKFQKNYLPIIAFSAAAILLFGGAIGFAFWMAEHKSNNRELKLTKLTTSGKVTNATLTPDSKYAVFSQTETDGESLWLRHIATGSRQQILPVKPVRFVGLAVSPEGDTIYATVFSPALPDPQIWRVPLLGGSTEEIKGIATGAAVSFSPAGDKIAFIESRSSINENHLLIADANGANKKLLSRAQGDVRSFANFNANPVAWSPDGIEIACAAREKTGTDAMKAGILLVNPADGSERFISEKRWDYVEHLTWIDAENLAFVAYTSEPWQGQIWTISKWTGEVRQITKDLNSYSWLASGGGNLLTVQKNAVSHVSIGDFDERKNQFEPREILKESGLVDNVAFASDGAILYSSSASGKREIWRMNRDGSNPTQLTVNANVTFGLTISPIDGAIVFCSTDDGKHSLKLANVDGKNIRPLTEGTDDVYPNFTADGQAVIYQHGLDNKLITLWRVSLSDKNPLQLTKTHSTHPAISHDGTLTAYYFMDAETDGLWRIGLAASENGSFVGKLSFSKAVTERRMRWHPSGKFIGQILYAGEDINLLLLPTAGGESQIVSGLGKGDINWFEWSRDGKQIVISHTTETQDVVFISR